MHIFDHSRRYQRRFWRLIPFVFAELAVLALTTTGCNSETKPVDAQPKAMAQLTVRDADSACDKIKDIKILPREDDPVEDPR